MDRNAPVLEPLDHTQGSQPLSVQERRLDAFQAWTVPLDLAPVPKVKWSDNALEKLHTSAASENQRRKEEKKILKDQAKAHRNYEKDGWEAV